MADSEELTSFMEQIRGALTTKYARFPYWKSLGTFTALLCRSAQYEEFRHAIPRLKDLSGFHINVMLGTCLVDVDDGRNAGEPTWGLYYSGKHYGALRAAISEWCERLGEEVKLEKEPGRRYQQVRQLNTHVETIAQRLRVPRTLPVLCRRTTRNTPTRLRSSTGKTSGARAKPDWIMWSPFQSPKVREICAHDRGGKDDRGFVRGVVWLVGLRDDCRASRFRPMSRFSFEFPA